MGHRCSTELRTRVNGIGGQADLLSTTFSLAASGAYSVGGEIPPNVDRREVRMGIRDGPFYFGPLYFGPPAAKVDACVSVGWRCGSILNRRMFSSEPTLSIHGEIRTICRKSLSGGKN